MSRLASNLTAVLLLALCGCTAPSAPRGPACLDALAARGVAFEPVADRAEGKGCGLATGVVIRQSATVIEPEATMTCPLAITLSDFEQTVLQPAAQRHFGRPVRAIRHWGAYSCRFRAGMAGRLSQHAFGQAIDVAAFDIEDGPRVSVREHWRDKGPRGRFLREVARGACGVFDVVLTPNHDRAHIDHLHLDIGPHRLCGF